MAYVGDVWPIHRLVVLNSEKQSESKLFHQNIDREFKQKHDLKTSVTRVCIWLIDMPSTVCHSFMSCCSLPVPALFGSLIHTTGHW